MKVIVFGMDDFEFLVELHRKISFESSLELKFLFKIVIEVLVFD